ncbi:MAG: hypothetical protein ACRCX2_04705 [Paraclostridium sp.]
MMIKEVEIGGKMGLKLLREDDLFVVRLYEDGLAGYKESVVYKCKVSYSSVDNMIEYLDNTHRVIMNK